MTLESKSKWIVKEKVDKSIDINEAFKLLLGNREIEDVDKFLNPNLDQIPSHNNLYNASSAAEKIINAVKENKKIVIYGDYDVDGISGTCILWSFLYFELTEILKIDKNDINLTPYIPDRVEEGYGLSIQSLDKLEAEGVDMIVTVDCGIRDKELIRKYENIEFIITDHHLPPEDLLQDLDYTIVHQLYPGKEYPDQSVCGAFLAFMLVLAMKEKLDLDSGISGNIKYLDLVALATVADIMPLRGINRVIVKYGLEVLQNTSNIGLRKLAEVAKIDLKEVRAYHLGFVLGPRLNASGRMDLGMHALKLLCTQNEKNAISLARKLDSLNFERQRLTKEMLDEAKDKIEDESILLLIGEGWSEGIIGLVASKIQEQFNKPTIAFAKNGDEIKGSARSIHGLNITEVISKFSKYLNKFGGHSQAAGLSLNQENFSSFKEEILSYAKENFPSEMFERKLDIDLAVSAELLNLDFAMELSKLEPFGFGNKRPVFMLENVVLASKRVLGRDGNHMKLELKGDSVGFVEAIMFNCEEDVGKINEDDVLDIVGCIGINEWNGNIKVQFEIKEWRYCKKAS